jgi:hypothetical protein
MGIQQEREFARGDLGVVHEIPMALALKAVKMPLSVRGTRTIFEG